MVTQRNSEQLDQQIRNRMSEYIEEYLQRCHSIFGKRPGCQDYLRMVPYCLPMHQVVIGQSSYAEDILPRYASAFAFDYRVHKSWMPTSQVLAQAMVMFHGCDIATIYSVFFTELYSTHSEDFNNQVYSNS